MRIKVTYTFEYDAVPEHYPEGERTAQAMADYDYNVDSAWFLVDCGESTELIAKEIKQT